MLGKMHDKKIRDILDWIETAELYKLLRDVEHGGIHIRRLIEQKLDERNLTHKEVCSNCAGPIDLTNTNTYTIIFGPHDLRKKATFCGMDCMESFLESIKDIKTR